MNTITAILACLLGISVVANILLANLCMTRQTYIDLFKTLYGAWKDIAESRKTRLDALKNDEDKVKVEN